MKRGWRPLTVLAGAAVAWFAVACLDVSSPVSGILSISKVITPTPSVVVGDSLRDTSGVTQPVRVYAFGPNGDTVHDAVVRFFVVDTTHQLHVDSVSGIVWSSGDTTSPNGAVFATVRPANGKGSIVTPLDTIAIVPKPDSAVADTNFLFTFAVGGVTDTSASDLTSQPFGVTIYGDQGVAVPKYVVGFQITRFPQAAAGATGPTAVLTSPLSSADSSYAVSDASGHATLRLRIRRAAISDSLRTGALTDTAVVHFHVQYRGAAVPVKPDSIVISIRSIFK